MTLLVALGASASAQPDLLSPPSVTADLAARDRETVGGAYARAMRQTGSIPYGAPYRGMDFERPNFGLRGDTNATRDAADQADYPSVPEKPPMANY